jgi:hypothetical protein
LGKVQLESRRGGRRLTFSTVSLSAFLLAKFWAWTVLCADSLFILSLAWFFSSRRLLDFTLKATGSEWARSSASSDGNWAQPVPCRIVEELEEEGIQRSATVERTRPKRRTRAAAREA